MWSILPPFDVGVQHRLCWAIASTHPQIRARTGAAAIAGAWLVAVSVAGSGRQDQRPAFRGGVDVIAVEVQVIDGDGRPVAGLTPEQFEVTLGGKRRRVVSADLVTAGTVTAAAGAAGASDTTPSRVERGDAPGPPARVWVLAFDCASFDQAEALRATRSARTFVKGLPASDLISIFTYPTGPRTDPTTDRDAIDAALSSVRGQLDVPSSRFYIRPSEIIDITAGDAAARRAAGERECGTDGSCLRQLDAEVTARAMLAEGRAHQSYDTLRALVRELARTPSRKNLVLVSGGLLSSDRPGGRPEVGAAPIDVGKDAAAANVLVYSLFLDHGYSRSNAAQARKVDRRVNAERDNIVMGAWLDRFAGAAGGGSLRDVIGDGETPFARVALETSAIYLLAVEPQDLDRDGRLREIKVRVSGRRLTIRGRTWIAVPSK